MYILVYLGIILIINLYAVFTAWKSHIRVTRWNLLPVWPWNRRFLVYDNDPYDRETAIIKILTLATIFLLSMIWPVPLAVICTGKYFKKVWYTVENRLFLNNEDRAQIACGTNTNNPPNGPYK
jgi:hypothetical protein